MSAVMDLFGATDEARGDAWHGDATSVIEFLRPLPYADAELLAAQF